MHERQSRTSNISRPVLCIPEMPHVLAAHISGMRKPSTFSPSRIRPMSFAWLALCQWRRPWKLPMSGTSSILGIPGRVALRMERPEAWCGLLMRA